MKILGFVLSVTIMLTIAAGGALVTVANAAAPGNPLYTIDREVEDIQLNIAKNQGSTERLQSQLAVERLEEVQKLLEQQKFEYLGQALIDAGLATSESNALAGLTNVAESELLDRMLNAAFDVQFQQDDNENGNENTNGNENANENGNENTNENENENTNANDNSNSNTNENGNENEHVTFKQPKSGNHCGGTGGANHPAGEKLAAGYEVDYGEIMDWFCRGYGFGEINLAYFLSQQAGVSVDEVFALRGSGVGWGNVMKEYGLIGKGSLKAKKGKNPNQQTGTQIEPQANPTPMPLIKSGKTNNGNSGNVKGNNGGNNGKNNNSNNGKKKGHP